MMAECPAMPSDRAPDSDAGRRLAERIAARIRRSGPLTFAEFMDQALYDAEGGFYSRPRPGEEGDFLTSPHVSPAFGRLLARQVVECWEVLGGPSGFAVVEVGAGDGTLAAQVLAGIPEGIRSSIHFTGVERGADARASLRERGLRAVSSLDRVAPSEAGMLFANELLDNLPFHRIRRRSTGLVELHVGLDGDRFVLVEGPLSDQSLTRYGARLRPGQDGVANVEADRFLERAASLFRRGVLWVDDYGFGGCSDAGDALVHGYLGHRVTADVLDRPGSRDITAGVDFERLVEHAAELGMPSWGPVSQRSALLALGFRDLETRSRAEQVEALDGRRGLDALRIYSGRTRANLLLATPGLGEFLVLTVGVGVTDPPPSVARAMWLEDERRAP
jgi:SAM-dependent MidA family methyltransferase